MSDPEKHLIAQTPAPRTRASLAHDLRALGVEAGITVLVHSSLRAIGWVVGGPQSVIHAFMDVVGPSGTLVMPAFSPEVSDPAEWEGPPLPVSWLEEIRAHLPLFDPATTPTSMGRIAEVFRTWPGVHRSTHPQDSFCAWGKHAEAVVAQQPLAWPLGEGSPMAHIYALDGQVLLLGVGYNRASSLHYAEIRSPHRRTQIRRFPLSDDGTVVWREIPDVAFDHGRFFPSLGADFEKTGKVRLGSVGSADSRLMPQRGLVDFAVEWFNRVLPGDAGADPV